MHANHDEFVDQELFDLQLALEDPFTAIATQHPNLEGRLCEIASALREARNAYLPAGEILPALLRNLRQLAAEAAQDDEVLVNATEFATQRVKRTARDLSIPVWAA